jgi:hypothetical protein
LDCQLYLRSSNYETTAIGAADDTLDADGIKAFDYWQAQEQARRWGERQRLIAAGSLRKGTYTAADYVTEISAEKNRQPSRAQAIQSLDPTRTRRDSDR